MQIQKVLVTELTRSVEGQGRLGIWKGSSFNISTLMEPFLYGISCAIYVYNCAIALKFGKSLISAAVEERVKFQRDTVIQTTTFAASGPREILPKDVLSDIEKGLWHSGVNPVISELIS